MIRKWPQFLNFLLIICPVLAAANLDNETVVFPTESFPPLHVAVDGGEIVGIHKNLADELFAKAGIKLKQVQYPYARSLGLLKMGSVGMIQVDEPRLTNENDEFYFPVPPIPIEIRMWVAKDDLAIPDNLEDFKGHSFVVVKDWPLGKLDDILTKENKEIRLSASYSPASAVKMLFRGRIDFLVTYVRPFNLYVNRYALDVSSLRSQSVHKSNGYSFGIPKTYPYAKELYTRLKAEYDKMLANGDIITDKEYVMLKGDDPNLYFFNDDEAKK